MARLNSSIPRTPKALSQISVVRRAYHDLVSEHKVLSTATELGLEVLVAQPTKLSKSNKEGK